MSYSSAWTSFDTSERKKRGSLRSSLFTSQAYILHQAAEQELLDHLDRRLIVRGAQQEKLIALVEDLLAMRDELEQATMEPWPVEDTVPRTSLVTLGLAGLTGYLIGRGFD